MSFCQLLNTVNFTIQSTGKTSVQLKKMRVKTKTLKSRGKINIRHQSRGRNKIVSLSFFLFFQKAFIWCTSLPRALLRALLPADSGRSHTIRCATALPVGAVQHIGVEVVVLS